MHKVQHGSATALWQALVREGEQRRHLALGEELESYLVFALMRHLGDAMLGTRIMALDWLRAHEPPQRPDHLRDVGDRCLLIAGLFPQLGRRRQVGSDYYVTLGSGAYASAAARAPRCERPLFDRLAEAFGSLVAVLDAIRPQSATQALPVPPAALAHRHGLH